MVMTSIHDLQVEDQTDAGLPCVSSPEDVTLTKAMWQGDLGSFISGVDDKGNVLTATGYVPATKVLTVTGWVTPATTCTIVYETDGLTAFTGMGALVGITPLLVWIGFLFSMVFSIWSGVKGKFGD
jgi:hypothetical protein